MAMACKCITYRTQALDEVEVSTVPGLRPLASVRPHNHIINDIIIFQKTL